MLKVYSNRDLDYVDKVLMPKISRTFYLTLQSLPEDLRRDCLVAYAFCRAIDNQEDSRLKMKEKIDLMNETVSTFSNGDVKSARKLQRRLGAIGQKKEGYLQLMKNYSRVVGASQVLGKNVTSIIAECGRQMIDGLSNPEIQRIETLDDHHRYCHYAAGVVGYFITKDLVVRGYISSKLAKKIMPSTHDNNPFSGVNPAHDFAVALQLANNIRDYHDDYKNSIFRWPSDLLANNGLNYEELANPRLSGRKLEKAVCVLTEQIEDAQKFFPAAAKWIDRIPYEARGKPKSALKGIKKSWGSALALSVATLTKINSSEFFTDPTSRKLSKEELYEVVGAVSKTVNSEGKIESLVDLLLR